MLKGCRAIGTSCHGSNQVCVCVEGGLGDSSRGQRIGGRAGDVLREELNCTSTWVTWSRYLHLWLHGSRIKGCGSPAAAAAALSFSTVD